MRTPLMPANLDPGLIGQIVVIQVIPRDEDGSLDLEKLQKYVGKLQAYFTDEKLISFKLKGIPFQRIPKRRYLVEVYVDSTFAEIFKGEN